MALNSTIYKIDLDISDIDAGFYETHRLVISQHPSEAADRLIVRILVFAIHLQEQIRLGSELCVPDQPDLHFTDLTGDVVHWIDVGLPDEKRVKRASRRSERTTVYAYGSGAAEWWSRSERKLASLRHVTVKYLETDFDWIADILTRTLAVQVLRHDGVWSISINDRQLPLKCETWLAPSG